MTVTERFVERERELTQLAAFTEGAREGLPAARRQVVACAKQADTWGGQDPGTRPFFLTLVDEYDAAPPEQKVDRAFRDSVGTFRRMSCSTTAPLAMPTPTRSREFTGEITRSPPTMR